MRLVPTDSLPPDTRLGLPLHDAGGTLLLGGGLTLTPDHLAALRRRGVRNVYVEDPQTPDILPLEVVPDVLRRQVARDLHDAFAQVRGGLTHVLPPPASSAAGAAAGGVDTNNPDFRRALRKAVDAKALWAMMPDVDLLLAEIADGAVLSGLGSLRTHDSYTFDHSVDVTILGLLLARRAGWEGRRLKLFGLGLLLHDIGKLFVDPAVLTKPAPLTDAEADRVRQHPALGYALIRELMGSLGPLPAQVALQHHERQDGTGYPRGLRGPNYLGRSPPGQIHEFGSLAAVADVYDALASDRPYRPGHPADHVVRFVTSLAGTHLNRSAVELFRQVVAPYPVCTEVVFRTGPLAGWTAVVAALAPEALDRPRLRVVADAAGRAVAPFDVDLAADPDVLIDTAAARAAGRPAA